MDDPVEFSLSPIVFNSLYCCYRLKLSPRSTAVVSLQLCDFTSKLQATIPIALQMYCAPRCWDNERHWYISIWYLSKICNNIYIILCRITQFLLRVYNSIVIIIRYINMTLGIVLLKLASHWHATEVNDHWQCDSQELALASVCIDYLSWSLVSKWGKSVSQKCTKVAFSSWLTVLQKNSSTFDWIARQLRVAALGTP